MDRGPKLLLLILALLSLALAAPAAVAGEGIDPPPTTQSLPGSESTAPATSASLSTGSITTATQTTGTDADTTANTQTAADTNIELTQRLRLVPDRAGIYEASHRYRLPDRLRALEVTLPEGATVVSATGFVHRDGRTYEWDRSTTRPRIDYRLPANQSVDRSGPIGGPGRLTFVDVGEWALVSQPSTSHSWGWVRGDGQIGFETSLEAEQGATGDAIAYLGPYEERTHTAHGQQFRLIVPEAADLEVPPETLFASFASAADRLRVGDRDETVFVVAAPTPERLDWGVRGLHAGDSDMWVRDVERIDEANNVWLHEYVHSRQGYTAAPDSRWFTEGAAVYYAALLTLEQDRITYDAFRERLRYGERSYEGSILAQPGTWQRNANYHVGALVAGELDRQLRLATDGDASLQEVFRRMNAKDGVVTGADLRSSLRATGGSAVADLGDRYLETTARPSVWSDAQHREAFEAPPEPARITYAFPANGDADAVRVDGPYRSRSLGPERPITLVPGERLSVDVVATNFGGTDGDYEAILRVDDEPRSTQSGRLGPNESRRLTFDHAVDRTGITTLSVGDATLRVVVRDPATPRVTALSANRSAASPGEWVEVTAAVENDAGYPAATNLSFTRNGEAIGTRSVRLDADTGTTVSLRIRLDEPGTAVFGVENAAVSPAVVAVSEPTPEPSTASDTSTPGFGVAVTVAAVLFGLLGFRKRG
ncbi:hypothetical protein [Halobellus ordinarius]|uniref:hypothetical protein n=1 Tax=Halobellus ordinarius TaxID=3075120 RepID=UPI0028805356|nr:hypothetical protein [Halobellus sp. ZY16]